MSLGGHGGEVGVSRRVTHVAIACGGTGGHLYPGLAIAERVWEAGVRVTLVVSAKEVDQQAVRGDSRFEVMTVPAVGFSWKRPVAFWKAFARSYRLTREAFRDGGPEVILSMGGFTSVPPALAVWRRGGRIVFHEANAIPGRANRWLARMAAEGFVFFPEALSRLRCRNVEVVGMPVRRSVCEGDAVSSRMVLGLATERPVLLVMGGSQGATGVNAAMLAAAPRLAERVAGLQILHLTGVADEECVRTAYRALGIRSVVRAFLTEMELALASADAVVARAGASSAAEFAALGLPPCFLPYPSAADDHQTANARALERTGAAIWMPQWEASADSLAGAVAPLLIDEAVRARMRRGLAQWHRADADLVIAERLLGISRSAQSGVSAAGLDHSSAEIASTA